MTATTRRLAAENAALTEDVATWKAAAEQAEHQLLMARANHAELITFYLEWVEEEMVARRIAEADRDSLKIHLGLAECMRDLLLESSRCLPVLDGVNAMQGLGDAPIFEAVERAVA